MRVFVAGLSEFWAAAAAPVAMVSKNGSRSVMTADDGSGGLGRRREAGIMRAFRWRLGEQEG